MKTNHLPLIVGVALPIVFIIIISIVIFIPSLSIRPEHNFIYTFGSLYPEAPTGTMDYYSNNSAPIPAYTVENSHIMVTGTSTAQTSLTHPLYLYDVKTNSTHEISLQDAKGYALDSGPSSPDGYTVQYEYNNDGIFDLFGGGDRSGYFAEKDKAKKELTGLSIINTNGYFDAGNFILIGWVK